MTLLLQLDATLCHLSKTLPHIGYQDPLDLKVFLRHLPACSLSLRCRVSFLDVLIRGGYPAVVILSFFTIMVFCNGLLLLQTSKQNFFM